VLANAFLNRFAKEQNIEEKKIDPEAMDILINYTWPGNVRELKNIIERLVIMTKEVVIKSDDIIQSLKGVSSSNDFTHLFNLDLKEAKDTFEQHYIAYKLSQCGDNISKTAETIGIERSHLHRKIKSLKIKFKGDSKK
jgi:Response regulator containing CheY-like receiver, AAA-type ATPase, and DNA-binding domains